MFIYDVLHLRQTHQFWILGEAARRFAASSEEDVV